MAGDNDLRSSEASRGALRDRLLQYFPIVGVVLAAIAAVLGTVYLLGGKELVVLALGNLSRWNPAWMLLSVFAFYLIASEITATPWFRRLGIEMVQERLHGLVLALVLGSFCLLVPFRIAWTNYWLLRDGHHVSAVVTDMRDHGSVGYRYRVGGREYTASAYCPHEASVFCLPGETIGAYYSTSHPSVSEIQHPVSLIDGAWPVMIFFTWPFEFMAIATAISPQCKWAYRSGTRNVLPQATRGSK